MAQLSRNEPKDCEKMNHTENSSREEYINFHVFSEGTSEVERILRFRDWLRTNEADREKYAQVKRELARQVWDNVQNYADAKTAVVSEVMGRAVTAE